MRVSLSLLITAVLLSNTASAHGLWTEQRRGHIETIYGHGAEDNAFDAKKITAAWTFDEHGQPVANEIVRLDDHARIVPVGKPAVLAVELDNGPWSKNAQGQWINQGRRQVPDSTQSLHTYKYSLAIYREGAKLPALDALKLVIVPQRDPLTVGVGNALPVQVLADGKPVAGVKLVGDYRGAPHQVSATTDQNGRAEVPVRNEGLNVISASLDLPVNGDPDIETRGLFSSLTFVGEPHRE